MNHNSHCSMCDAQAKQEKIALLRSKGLTYAMISDQMGVSRSSAHRSLKRYQRRMKIGEHV